MLVLSWVPHSHCFICHTTLSLLIYASSSTTRQTVSSLKPGTYFNPVNNPTDEHRTDWHRGVAEKMFVELMDFEDTSLGCHGNSCVVETWNFHPESEFPLVKGFPVLILHICMGISMSIYCKGEIFMTLRQKPGQEHRDGFVQTSLELFVHLILHEKLSKSSH